MLSQISAFEWRHSVTVSATPDVRERHVRINLIRLSRALVNLLDNANLAARDAKAKGIALSAAVDGNDLQLCVIDNGPGFSENYAADGRGLSEWGSTGIGLAFVEAVAKHHGGHLSIANRPEGGAVVTLHLPTGKKEP